MFESNRNRHTKRGPLHERVDPDWVLYKRLGDGTWGLRGPESRLVPGKVVQVHKRDGTTRDEVVGELIRAYDGGVAVTRIARPDRVEWEHRRVMDRASYTFRPPGRVSPWRANKS